MKRTIIFCLIFLPVIILGQGIPLKSSPLPASWNYVGVPGFSNAYANYLSFTVSPAGVPWVA